MKVAVVGASGVVGRALMTQLQMAGIEAVALARRPPDLPHIEFISLDLQDVTSCRAAASKLLGVTHVVYAALYEKPGLISGWREQDQMQTNLSMIKNCFEIVFNADQLQHIALLQGTKAYGAHIAPMRIPGKEREDRVAHENFYWLQEDYLRQRQSDGAGFCHSIWRPQVVVGHGEGAPMNMLAAIGAFAAFCRFDGEPFYYPGGPNAPIEATDANLLADAIIFGLESESAQDQTFNVTNGDVFEWRNLWPRIADTLSMPLGEPRPFHLVSLYEREGDWKKLCHQFGLESCTLKSFVGDSLFYADALFATGAERAPPPALLSTIKLRQAGFESCIDTEDMFSRWFKKLIMMNRLPQP